MYDKSSNISLSLAFAKAAKNGEIEDRKNIKKKLCVIAPKLKIGGHPYLRNNSKL